MVSASEPEIGRGGGVQMKQGGGLQNDLDIGTSIIIPKVYDIYDSI